MTQIHIGGKKMSIADTIKKSVLEKFQVSDLTTTSIIVTLGAAAVLGIFIYLVYRLTSKSSFYNRSFNKSLACLPVITAGIMLAMQSNLVISLGMVGALSIVRFRNAIKDSSDLTYLFWSISMGIVIGAGLFELAILLSLGIAVLMAFLDMLPATHAPCLLVVSGEPEVQEEQLLEAIKRHKARGKLRSRNVTKRGTEWIFELRTRNGSTLVQEITNVVGVRSANMLSHDGDVRF